MALSLWLLISIGEGHSQHPGPSPILGSFGPSHQRHHKSRVSLEGFLCAQGVLGTPHGEMRDTISQHRKPPFGCQLRGYIVTKLHSTHIIRSISLVLICQIPQVLVRTSIHTLYFSLKIFVWFRPKVPSKSTFELWISIRYNHSWQPVVPPPSFENMLCSLYHGCSSHNRQHVY